jgi:hypothetical protein
VDLKKEIREWKWGGGRTEEVQDGEYMWPVPQDRSHRYETKNRINRRLLSRPYDRHPPLTGTTVSHNVTHPSQLFYAGQHVPTGLPEGLEGSVFLLLLEETELRGGEVVLSWKEVRERRGD